MAAIYQSGTKWVVKTSTATYNLDSGDVILTETFDGNYFQLKLKDGLQQIISSSYLLIANDAGTLYTKPQLVEILDQMVVSSANTSAEVLTTMLNYSAGAATADKQDDALGKISQIVTGIAKTAIKAGYYAYGCTCRVAGSMIASLEKTQGVTISEDTEESITGIAMVASEWQPFINKVTSVTQTSAGDSITYWLKPLIQSAETDLFIAFPDITVTDYNVDGEAKTIDVTVPSGTAIDALVATFIASSNVESVKIGSTVQESAVTENDFTTPLTYTIVAEDGVTTTDWVVTVIVSE